MACGRYPFETGPEMAPGSAMQPVRSSLYLRLMDLLASARMGRLDVETLAERGGHLQMDRLLGASEPFDLAGGVRLRDCLFVGPQALSAAFWEDKPARSPLVLVLVVVETASARALYFRSGKRIDLQDGVSGAILHGVPFGPGPYLALIAAELDWLGIPRPRSAAVAPVWRHDQFTPLACSEEREMFDCLAAIMERLDCHGFEMRIARELGADGPAPVLSGRMSRNGPTQWFEVICLPGVAGQDQFSPVLPAVGRRIVYRDTKSGSHDLFAEIERLARQC